MGKILIYNKKNIIIFATETMWHACKGSTINYKVNPTLTIEKNNNNNFESFIFEEVGEKQQIGTLKGY